MTASPIVFIFSDQQHGRAIGCRDPHFCTPCWDAFARDGVRFDTTYCTTPLCSPSRATLLTGLMPSRHGVTDNGVPLERPTIATRLQQAGYHTAYFGKWHLRDKPISVAGWDEQCGVCDEYVLPNRVMSDAETRAAAVQYLRRRAWGNRPCALFVSLDQPHGVYWAIPRGPYPADFMQEPPLRDETQLPVSWQHGYDPAIRPDDYVPSTLQPAYQYWQSLGTDTAAWRRYREIYRACVAAYDASLGAVLEAVRAAGIYDDALIVVTSDHGDMDAHHRMVFKGAAPYEELQRVPLAIKAPRAWQTPAGRVDTASLVSLADLFPTLLEAAGALVPACDGVSLLPVLREQRDRHARTEITVEYPGNAYRTVRRGARKHTRLESGRELLFDVDQDPFELYNLASSPQ